MNFDKIDEIQITVQFCARCWDCCGCWVLDTAVVDVDTGV